MDFSECTQGKLALTVDVEVPELKGKARKSAIVVSAPILSRRHQLVKLPGL
jgi:hypothetical protein